MCGVSLHSAAELRSYLNEITPGFYVCFFPAGSEVEGLVVFKRDWAEYNVHGYGETREQAELDALQQAFGHFSSWWHLNPRDPPCAPRPEAPA